jgi:hypothetical protein
VIIVLCGVYYCQCPVILIFADVKNGAALPTPLLNCRNT